MNQKNIKIIAPSKNTFQNTGALQNCFLKKCILELLALKYLLKEILIDEQEILTNKNSLKRFR